MRNYGYVSIAKRDIMKKIVSWVKDIWAPIASFIGTTVVLVEFIKLWQSSPVTVPIVIISLLVGILIATLVHVAFSRKTSYSKRQKRILVQRFPNQYKLARIGLSIVIFLFYWEQVIWVWQIKLLEEKFVVLVANFDGPEEKKYRVTEHVYSELEKSFSKVPYSNVEIRLLEQSFSTDMKPQDLKNISLRNHADLVI